MISRSSQTFGNMVFEDLLKKISAGTYKAGSRLPTEFELAKAYGVSRPVIRSALAELRAQGFIVSTRGVGSFVKRSNSALPEILNLEPVKAVEDMLKCFEFRVAIEGPMAYWAALRCDPHDRIEIQRAFDATENAFEKGEATALNTDIKFHMAIAEATHNRFFTQAMQTIRLQMAEGMESIAKYFVGEQARHYSIKSTEHSLITEGILKGDGEMARAAMILHLERSKNWILAAKK